MIIWFIWPVLLLIITIAGMLVNPSIENINTSEYSESPVKKDGPILPSYIAVLVTLSIVRLFCLYVYSSKVQALDPYLICIAVPEISFLGNSPNADIIEVIGILMFDNALLAWPFAYLAVELCRMRKMKY